MKGIVISSDSNRATQYKILKDAVPVFCAEKGYNGVGGIVHEMKDWVEHTFYPDPPSDAERTQGRFLSLIGLCFAKKLSRRSNRKKSKTKTLTAIRSRTWLEPQL